MTHTPFRISPIPSTDPFRELGLAPTLDSAVVKRNYFKLVQAMGGPQRDPERFRRVRSAYDELSRPGGLSAAFMSAPIAIEGRLATMCATWSPILEDARQAHVADEDALRTLEQFVRTVSRQRWSAIGACPSTK
jgi:hypothetical protein